jgi:hypothetical protein
MAGSEECRGGWAYAVGPGTAPGLAPSEWDKSSKPSSEVVEFQQFPKNDWNTSGEDRIVLMRARCISPFAQQSATKDCTGGEDPQVFAWMPAVAIYFNDPGGHLWSVYLCSPTPRGLNSGCSHGKIGVAASNSWQARMPIRTILIM